MENSTNKDVTLLVAKFAVCVLKLHGARWATRRKRSAKLWDILDAAEARRAYFRRLTCQQLACALVTTSVDRSMGVRELDSILNYRDWEEALTSLKCACLSFPPRTPVTRFNERDCTRNKTSIN